MSVRPTTTVTMVIRATFARATLRAPRVPEAGTLRLATQDRRTADNAPDDITTMGQTTVRAVITTPIRTIPPQAITIADSAVVTPADSEVVEAATVAVVAVEVEAAAINNGYPNFLPYTHAVEFLIASFT